MERFCEDCAAVGVDGTIIPDLPMYEYEQLYQETFAKNNLSNIFLITPQTSDERIRKIDSLTTGFIYMLSSSATTGKNLEVGDTTEAYFSRIAGMNLKNPRMIGFGISDKLSFAKAAQYANGAIVGSAFVKVLGEPGYMDKVPKFADSIRP
jgi:tryptophan synthase alpha chain